MKFTSALLVAVVIIASSCIQGRLEVFSQGRVKGQTITSDQTMETMDARSRFRFLKYRRNLQPGVGPGPGLPIPGPMPPNSKGKGGNGGGPKGKGPPSPPSPPPPPPPPVTNGCKSPLALDLVQHNPEVLTANPPRCCSYTGPLAVFITHAQYDPTTGSGFELFWDAVYNQLTGIFVNMCFLVTGVNQTYSTTINTLETTLIQVNTLVAQYPNVSAMMSTDPTQDSNLVNLFRNISDTPNAPSIGVFNEGYGQIVIESVVSGKGALPYVGSTNNEDYGTQAAAATLALLHGTPAIPLCFNGRPDLPYIGERCAAYYSTVSTLQQTRPFGITCRADSSIDSILALILQTNATAIYSYVDCCTPVGQAVALARQHTNRTIILGCQDENTAGSAANFVTAQPMELQVYQSSAWTILPVIEAFGGQNETAGEYFPSLQSLVETDVFNQILFTS